jgi:hypothetical protein
MKSNMASAGVVLGLTPTILAMLGSSTTDTALLSIVAMRPLLALCLAIGSPAASPLRPFEYVDPIESLASSGERKSVPLYGITGQLAVSIVEYLIVFAAITNIASVSYQLGIQTICSFSVETTFQPLLWAFVAAFVHIGGSLAMKLHVRVMETDRPQLSRKIVGRYILHYLRLEFTPSAYHPRSKIDRKPKTNPFLFISWMTSVGTVLHVLYGTLVFSGLLFISVQDALSVVTRYLASVICCRALLAYELAGLRQVYVG